MRENDAIAKANELRMNTLGDEIKAKWLAELDGQLLEMMQRDLPPKPAEGETEAAEDGPTWPTSGIWPAEDPALLMPEPHDMIYVYYLIVQIDYYSQETDLYANDMAIYNAAMRDARAWWRRNHRPRDSGNWRVM